MPFELRVLGAADALAYRDLRLQALREHPEAFLSSEDEEAGLSLADWQARLAPNAQKLSLGAFTSQQLVGTATLLRGSRSKVKHKADVVAVYVAPVARRSGLGRQLLRGLIAQARQWDGLSHVKLTVTSSNAAAISLYASLGFVVYGREVQAMRVDAHFYDELLMQLELA